jgi:competence protein ComEA
VKFTGPNFYLSKAQRNALLILTGCLFIVSGLQHLLLDHSPLSLEDQAIESHQITIDSLAKNKKVTPSFFSFNPNYLSEDKAYTLGIPLDAIDRILAYRQSGNWFRSVEEFERIAQMNDSLMSTLVPLIRMPRSKKIKLSPMSESPKTDINQCSATDLISIRGIGPKLSQRIIKYRNYLKFFSDMDQLYEVYGLDSSVVVHLHKRFEIRIKPEIRRIGIDTATQRDLNDCPIFQLLTPEISFVGEQSTVPLLRKIFKRLKALTH